MKNKSILIPLLATLLLLPSFAISADVASVTLAWDPVSGPDVTGYALFVRENGQAYDYENPEWSGADPTCTLGPFDATETYYFVVRAVDSEGNTSGDSNEVHWDPRGGSSGSGTTLNLDGSGSNDAGAGGCFISSTLIH